MSSPPSLALVLSPIGGANTLLPAVDPSGSVESLRTTVASTLQLDVTAVRLVHDGTELIDGHTIADYSLPNYAPLRVIISGAPAPANADASELAHAADPNAIVSESETLRCVVVTEIPPASSEDTVHAITLTFGAYGGLSRLIFRASGCPRFGGFVHFGATSQDVNDTVTALQLSEVRGVLGSSLQDVRRHLTRLALAHKGTVCIGRTHGQHAIPITMGFKFANFLYELSVAGAMLDRVQLLAKFSGAVGTYASLGGAPGRAVQAHMCASLGLSPAPISTQVVSRLHYADFLFGLGAVAAALERLGKEFRALQRTEIGETSEGFGEKQVSPGLETVSLEHERDLTNSSTERVTLSTASCLTHYMLLEMAKILAVLHVDEEAVNRNLRAGGGAQMSERVMMALAPLLGRQEAHEILRTHAGAPDFVAALNGDARVTGALGAEGLAALLDPTTYTGASAEVVDEIVAEYGVAW